LLHNQSITILAPYLGKVAYGTKMEGEKKRGEDTGEETEGKKKRGETYYSRIDIKGETEGKRWR
jgi:hypothetical protein